MWNTWTCPGSRRRSWRTLTNMYLKEIGKIPLLGKGDEVETGKKDGAGRPEAGGNGWW